MIGHPPSAIELQKVTARAGTFTLSEATLRVAPAEWSMVIGPAGAGKTTLLEVIAGLRPTTSGTLSLRGVNVESIPANARGIGMVFQHSHLFPHLDVARNISYGAVDASLPRELSGLFEMDALLGRAVSSLSGGERQTVALVRALARRPDILLLDEPFSALDPRRRQVVRLRLRELQRERQMTILQVTHDFSEARILGTSLMLLLGGAIVQTGQPEALFRTPRNVEVAEFLGFENVFPGFVRRRGAGRDGALTEFESGGLRLAASGTATEGSAHAVVRAEDILLVNPGSERRADCNYIECVVSDIQREGLLSRVTLEAGHRVLTALVTTDALNDTRLAMGSSAVATIATDAVCVC